MEQILCESTKHLPSWNLQSNGVGETDINQRVKQKRDCFSKSYEGKMRGATSLWRVDLKDDLDSLPLYSSHILCNASWSSH